MNEFVAKNRMSHAADVLRRLDKVGAIKLDVLLSKASEIGEIAGVEIDDPEHGICYPAYIHIGPRRDIDLISVVAELNKLGFDVRNVSVPRVAGAKK